MSNLFHIFFAFLSGTIMEMLYALGVIFINERNENVSALLAIIWGACAIVAGYETIQTWMAGIAWCLGLGLGTILGIRLKKKKTLQSTNHTI